MDASIEVEMRFEKLESEFTLTRFDKNVLNLFGSAPVQRTPLIIRDPVNGEWLVTRTEYQLDASGLQTRCDAEVPITDWIFLIVETAPEAVLLFQENINGACQRKREWYGRHVKRRI